MLPQPNRLPAYRISQVMKQGKRVSLPGIIFLITPSSEPVSRFAFVVGTTVDKRAVVRNRIKRLLRESVQHLLPGFMVSVDAVVIARRELIGLNQKEIQNRLTEILHRVKEFTET